MIMGKMYSLKCDVLSVKVVVISSIVTAFSL